MVITMVITHISKLNNYKYLRASKYRYSLSMEQGKNPLAVRRWSRLWDASAAATSGVSRSFAFCAITKRYLRRERSPFTVTIMAIARGGLASDVNGVLSPQSKTAAVSEGMSAGP